MFYFFENQPTLQTYQGNVHKWGKTIIRKWIKIHYAKEMF